MRLPSLHYAVLLATLSVLASPAFAGDVSVINGQATWRSTECTAPAVPASLTSASSETAAEDMNTRMAQYNAYVQLAQAYTECMSNEAQNDANGVSHAIIGSAQAMIEETQNQVDALGAPLKRR